MYLLNSKDFNLLRIIILLSLFSLEGIADIPNDAFRSVRHFNDQNGLPQNSINSIARDKNGYIWLSTENGLVRYDGQRFNIFNLPNVSSNRIYSIQPDMEEPFDKLYVKFELGDYAKIEEGRAVPDSVNYLIQLRKLGYDTESPNLRFMTGSVNSSYAGSLRDIHIIPVTEKRGTFFVYKERKIHYYSNWKKVREILNEDNAVETLFRFNGVLFANKGDGRFRQVMSEKTYSEEPDYLLAGDLLQNPGYYKKQKQIDVYWNNTANQVFLTLGKDLYVVDSIRGRFLNTKLLIRNFDFQKNYIKSIFHNPQTKEIYLGSYTKGLYIVRESHFTILRFDSEGFENIIYAQTVLDSHSVQMSDGRVLGFIPGYNPKRFAGQGPPEMKDTKEYRLLVDQDKSMWTVRGDSLICFAEDRKTIRVAWNMGGEISDFHIGYDNSLWIAMVNNLIYRIAPDDSSLRPALFVDLNLSGIRLNYLIHHKKDTMLIGTNKGVYQFQLSAKSLGLISGTQPFNVRSIYITYSSRQEDEIWIATYNKGFALFKDGTLSSFPMDRNHFLTTSHYFYEDNNHYFWIPTNNGLFQIHKNDLLEYAASESTAEPPFYLYYSTEDGFLINEFNGGCRPCAVRLSSGYVSLPTLNGLVWFIPEMFPVYDSDYDIFLDQVIVNGTPVNFSGSGLILPQKSNETRLLISTPFFGNINNLNLSYALINDGNQPRMSDWVNIETKSGVIDLSRLTYGQYKLYIRKRKWNGDSPYHYREFYIDVPSYWYQTWQVKVVAIIFIALLIYWFFKLKTREITRRNIIMENKIADRTRELEEMLYSLRLSESELRRQLQLHIRMIASISHDIKTPVNFIRKASDQIKYLLVNREFDTAEQAVESISFTSRQIGQLLESMVAFIKSEMQGSRNSLKETDLKLLILKKAELFKAILLVFRVELEVNIESTYLVKTNENLLSVIVHNLIDNAIKVKKGNKIRIYTIETYDSLRLVISDEGPGMPLSLVTWLNSGTSATDETYRIPDQYEGMGLMMVKEIAHILGIKIYVEVEKETRIELIFSKNPQDASSDKSRETISSPDFSENVI